MAMGTRAKLKGGDEWDAFTGWRKVMKYLTRSGRVAAIKRRFWKRQRKASALEATSVARFQDTDEG